jgi:lipopolysaccharide cholinephosphotransferase
MSNNLSLEEIQQEILNLLIRFDEICSNNGFRYYLAYGTLLGAVRHKGFIPWDDDADVWMHREDVAKFIAYCEKNMGNSPYGIVSRSNTENYEYGILRFTNYDYIYESDIKDKKKEKMGIFIDIYFLDNYGDDVSVGEKIESYARKLNDDYTVYVNPISYTSKYRTIFKKMYSKYLHIKYGNNWGQKIDAMIERYIQENTSPNDRFIGVPSWESYGMMQFERELFSNTMRLEFEGHMLNCPVEYDKILCEIYGNYMELPPESKRIPHHKYSIVPR